MEKADEINDNRLKTWHLYNEAFKPLEDDAIFSNFKIMHGVITWMNDEIDCAPEYIYEHSFEYEDNTSPIAM